MALTADAETRVCRTVVPSVIGETGDGQIKVAIEKVPQNADVSVLIRVTDSEGKTVSVYKVLLPKSMLKKHRPIAEIHR